MEIVSGLYHGFLQFGRGSAARRAALLWPLALFCLLELTIYGLWRYVQAQDQAQIHRDTRVTAEQVSIRLEQNLALRLATLQLLRNDWLAGLLPHEIAFSGRVASLRSSVPGIDFFFSLSPTGALQWTAPGEVASDLRTDGIDKTLLDLRNRVIESHAVAASPPVLLANGLRGVLVCLSVERDGELLGFVGMVLRLDSFVNTVLGRDFAQRFTAKIADGDDLVFAVGKVPSAFISDAVRPIRFADRIWPLALAPRFVDAGGGPRGDQVGFALGSLLILGLAALLRLFLLRQAELEEGEQRFREMTDLLPDMVCELDANLNLTYANQAACRAFGLAFSEIDQGVSLLQLLAPTSSHDVQQLLNDLGKSLAVRSAILQIQRKDGVLFPGEATIAAITDEVNAVVGYRAVMRDITERRQTERRMQRLAHYDLLTDLPNRILFRDRLLQAMARAQRNNSFLAVVMIDLDRFKGVNDVIGQSNGDLVIQGVGERLLRLIRKTDTLARTGGDEFMLIAADITSHQDVPKVATRLAQQVQDELKRSFVAGGREVSLTASVGITLYPKDSASADDLMRHAEAAMYHSKAAGRNAFTFYSSSMHSAEKDRTELENRLRKALEQGEFILHFQAQRDIEAGRIIGAEVLLRWQNAERGLVSPMEFIPMIEEAGMSNALGEWVLKAACRQYAEWNVLGVAPQRLGINLSATQFRSPDLVRWVEWVLHETGMNPASLELEVTEMTLMEDASESLDILRRLEALGIRLSIDDFGTGYSSLSYLKRFPIHAIKIDQSFVREMDSDDADTAIVSAAINMANSLGLDVVAEGVETEQQLSLLRQLGCRYAQGYLFAHPETAYDFASRMHLQH